jgi:putative tryptophan/tyrosine transport system substrate-binding protein
MKRRVWSMRRREFIAGLSGAVAWPLAARAQQPSLPVIGYLSGGRANPDFAGGFRSGLAETGFVEGRNVAIEYRPSDNQYDRLPGLVADLIGRKVAVIAASGAAPAVAAKTATSTIPIVFFMGEDPVALGVVATLNRPGGNVTGVAFLSSTVVAKRLEQLHELVPRATVLATLVNPKNPNARSARRTRRAQHAGLAFRFTSCAPAARTNSTRHSRGSASSKPERC